MQAMESAVCVLCLLSLILESTGHSLLWASERSRTGAHVARFPGMGALVSEWGRKGHATRWALQGQESHGRLCP